MTVDFLCFSYDSLLRGSERMKAEQLVSIFTLFNVFSFGWLIGYALAWEIERLLLVSRPSSKPLPTRRPALTTDWKEAVATIFETNGEVNHPNLEERAT